MNDPFVTELQAGVVVDGRYEIMRPVALGGMACVHEARDLRGGRLVVIKMLVDPSSALLAERLALEATALDRLAHPNVVELLGAGTCPRHGPWLALERVDGPALDALVDGGRRFEVDDVVHLADQLGRALEHAHARGVLHRDVKPSNVMLARRPGHHSVKLIDWGIAVMRGQRDLSRPRLTRSGTLVGTAEYLAPEILVRGGMATVATDVYAMGATLYECLTGKPPRVGTVEELAHAMLAGEPIAPIRASRPDVPLVLEDAILTALAPMPSDRWERAELFAAACRSAAPRSADHAWVFDDGSGEPPGDRAHERAPFSSPVRVSTEYGAIDGRIEDVSEGGLCVLVDRPLREHHVVRIRWPLPGSGRIATTEAEVCWTRAREGGHHALGLSFVELDHAARLDVQRYVATMTAKQRAA